MHPHHRKVVFGRGKDQIERALVLLGGLLEQAEQRLGVAENIGRSNEAAHRPFGGEYGHLGRDRGAGSLGVRKLLAGADGAEWNIVSHDQPDG